MPDPSPATRHDTLPTVKDAGLLVRTSAEALHFNLELLSLLVGELGGDWSATTISELTTIPSSDVESAIRGLQFDGVAIRLLQRGTLIRLLAISAGSRGVSPASAGCTFATASTHTDACHSMFLSVITLLLSMWFRGRHWSVPVLALGFCSHPCCAAMNASTTKDLGFESSWGTTFCGCLKRCERVSPTVSEFSREVLFLFAW